MNPRILIKCVWLSVALHPGMLMADTGLSLSAAEQLALQQDSLIQGYSESAEALDEQAVAAGQWPDPKLKFGFLSLPTDTFELDQEPMTQVILGYNQMLPRGDSLDVSTRKMQAGARMQRADLELRKREVLLKVRKAWWMVYLQEQTGVIVEQTRALFEQQRRVSESLYAAGRKQQQDVLQAELELSLLDDRLQQNDAMQQESRVVLAQWLGSQAASRQLHLSESVFSVQLGPTIDVLVEALDTHPMLTKRNEKIVVSQQDIELARQKYKSQWGFDLTYGKRSGQNMDGSDRADFFSAMVSLDLPVFTEDRQDRVLAARKKQLQVSRYEKQDQRLKLVSQLKQKHVRWQQLKQRMQLYDHEVLHRARQNSKAALNGYQSGVVTFNALTRARSAELKAALQRLQLAVDQAIAYAEIRYLIGEDVK